MAYGRRNQYLDTFLGTSFNDEDNFGMGANSNSPSMTYVPMDPAAGAVTNNMKLGDPNNLVDTRNNPKVTAMNNLTNNNANIDAAYANSPYAVDVVAQRRPQANILDIRRDQPSLKLPELKDPNQSLGKMNQEEGYEKTREKFYNQFLADQKKRDITGGPGSNYTSKVYKSSGSPPESMVKDGSFDGTYTPNWGVDKVDLDKFPSYDTGKRFTNEQVAENLAMDKRSRKDEWKELVQKEYGVPTEGSSLGMSMDREMHLQGLKGPDYSGKSGIVSIDSMNDELSSIWDQDIDPMSIGENVAGSLTPNSMVDSIPTEVPEQLGQTLGSKIGEKAKSFMNSEFASKALAFSPLLSAVSNYKAQKDAINSLEDARGDAQSALEGLTESKAADMEATGEQYSEDVRRVGALENEVMADRIKKIQSAKTGGLVSGTQTEMTEDTIDQSRTKTDVSIAKLQDERAATEARLLSANRQERQKLNQTIAQLDAKIKEARRDQVTGPINAAIDVGSNLLMASNPALAIGMQVGKSLIS